MKNSKRIVLSLAAAATLLAGCGSSTKKDATAKKFDTAEPSSQQTVKDSAVSSKAPSQAEKNEAEESVKSVPVSEAVEDAPAPEPAPEPEAKPAAASGIRPEFKEAVDTFVSFYDDYIGFMKAYMANPTDLSLLLEMTSWVDKVDEMDEKLDAFDDASDSWTPEEFQYWTEAYVHISNLLLSITE